MIQVTSVLGQLEAAASARRDALLHPARHEALVAELAARFGGEVPGLTVTRPTLEDVYLEMIGAA